MGTKTGLAHVPQPQVTSGMAAAHRPGQPWGLRRLGFPRGAQQQPCSPRTLSWHRHSADLLRALMRMGVKSIPAAELPSKKKIKQQTRGKQPAICHTSDFQLDFQKHFGFLK